MPLAKHWVYQTIQTDEGNINLQAFYITREFESKPMATKYGQIAQYIECMVDTTTQVMLQSATVELGVEENDKTKLADFLRLTNNYGKKPTYDQYKIKNGSYDYARYQADFLHWDSLRLTWIDTSLAYTPAFQTALQAAVAECKTRKVPNATLEYFCGKYYSRADELLLARDRLVMGMGSIDAASRYHAREIAVLAAETAHWEVFLRSHLDIMNDRFDPLADNNYAKTTRQTYIKELENLGIDVPNLMLGICLRIENPSQNHYYGDIGRVGRALAESAQQAEIKTMLLDMIADATLDDYNRLLLFHTFLSYNLNLPDEATRTQNTQLLKRTCSSSFPRYLYEKMTW